MHFDRSVSFSFFVLSFFELGKNIYTLYVFNYFSLIPKTKHKHFLTPPPPQCSVCRLWTTCCHVEGGTRLNSFAPWFGQVRQQDTSSTATLAGRNKELQQRLLQQINEEVIKPTLLHLQVCDNGHHDAFKEKERETKSMTTSVSVHHTEPMGTTSDRVSASFQYFQLK